MTMANGEIDDSKYTQEIRIVGFAIDVSGSMQASIQNVSGEELSRLDAIRQAIDMVFGEAERLSQLSNYQNDKLELYFFAYAFGLRIPGSDERADLLRLLVEVKDELQRLASGEGAKRKYKREIERKSNDLKEDYERQLKNNLRSVAIDVMGSSAARLLYMSREEAESTLRAEIQRIIENKVRDHVISLAEKDIHHCVKKLLDKDVTFSLGDISERWAALREGIKMSNEFFGGSTPMCSTLCLVEERFERERAKRPAAKCVLFIVSDGEATDGDPRVIARRIVERGTMVVSCFVSSSDMLESRRLYAEADKRRWSRGAHTLFGAASQIRSESTEEAFLRQSGWQIDDGARLFAQVNHSEVLREFMRVVIAPLRAEHGLSEPKDSHVAYAHTKTGLHDTTGPAAVVERSPGLGKQLALPPTAPPRERPQRPEAEAMSIKQAKSRCPRSSAYLC